MNARFKIGGALGIAAAYLVLPWAARHLGGLTLDETTWARINGVLTGAILMVWANGLPKALKPLDRLGCDPAREQALRRRVAWAMVLAGLGYLLAFAFAPAGLAAPLAICLLLPAFVLTTGVLLRCAWARR